MFLSPNFSIVDVNIVKIYLTAHLRLRNAPMYVDSTEHTVQCQMLDFSIAPLQYDVCMCACVWSLAEIKTDREIEHLISVFSLPYAQLFQLAYCIDVAIYSVRINVTNIAFQK